MYIEIWKQGLCRQFTWNVDSYWPYETGLSSPDTKAIVLNLKCHFASSKLTHIATLGWDIYIPQYNILLGKI